LQQRISFTRRLVSAKGDLGSETTYQKVQKEQNSYAHKLLQDLRLVQHYDIPVRELIAHSFAKAGKDFGVPPGAALPGDIWDFIQCHQGIYTEVYPLGLLDDGNTNASGSDAS
jgi:hypothetical protein